MPTASTTKPGKRYAARRFLCDIRSCLQGSKRRSAPNSSKKPEQVRLLTPEIIKIFTILPMIFTRLPDDEPTATMSAVIARSAGNCRRKRARYSPETISYPAGPRNVVRSFPRYCSQVHRHESGGTENQHVDGLRLHVGRAARLRRRRCDFGGRQYVDGRARALEHAACHARRNDLPCGDGGPRRAAGEAAGAFSVLLECIPAERAARITETLSVPTIGIGAGAGSDGQVLVTHDMLGLTSGYVPRFVKTYANLRGTISDAVARYRQEVRAGVFPEQAQTFK